MKTYIQIDGSVGMTSFILGNCCGSEVEDETVTAEWTRTGKKKAALTVQMYRKEGEKYFFIWGRELFETLCAGWYDLKIINGCRTCGEFLVKLGADCIAKFDKNHDRLYNDCPDPGDQGEPCQVESYKVRYCDCAETCEESDPVDGCCCAPLPGIMKFCGNIGDLRSPKTWKGPTIIHPPREE